MKVLFLAKLKPFAKDVLELLQCHCDRVDFFWGEVGDPFPLIGPDETYDYVFSYISPWIIPQAVLDKAKKAAINFHPGPPEYPGIGCTNFAIYDGAKEYGITVHHMLKHVDRGRIISVQRFPVFPEDTVYTLTQRCYCFLFVSFIELFAFILKDQPLPACGEDWQRRPFTRRELQSLGELRQGMSPEEVTRRMKAMDFPGRPGAVWVD